MVAILRAVALGLLAVAVVLHVVGFATNAWISMKLDRQGIGEVMSAYGMGSQLPSRVTGLSINIGLWKYCMKLDTNGLVRSFDHCAKISSDDIHDWYKAVQALGILSMLTAAVGITLIIYSFIGDSKGDRARLLPVIMAAICFAAGVLLLIAVTVYGAEYKKHMQDLISKMRSGDSALNAMANTIEENTSLGYSFALEVVSGVLMVQVAPMLLFSARLTGSPHNVAM